MYGIRVRKTNLTQKSSTAGAGKERDITVRRQGHYSPTTGTLLPNDRNIAASDVKLYSLRYTRWHLMLHKMASYATQDGILYCSRWHLMQARSKYSR